MSCGCGTNKKDGKAVVDKVREVGRADMLLNTPHTINCSCGTDFLMETCVSSCPNCNMTYGVTPCSQDDVANVQAAGINY